jgi:hypothetical protein
MHPLPTERTPKAYASALPHRIVLQVSALSRSDAGGVGCSTETGSDAGKVSFRASSSASS